MLPEISSSPEARVGLWLLTYAVHSTLLLGLAWGLTRFLKQGSSAWVEGVWKTAIISSFFTTTLVIVQGPSLSVSLGEPSPHRITNMSQPIPIVPLDPIPLANTEPRSSETAEVLSYDQAILPKQETLAPSPKTIDGTRLLLWLWMGVASLLTLRLIGNHLRFIHRWRRPQPVSDRRLLHVLGRLSRASGISRAVKLVHDSELAVPVSMGWWRPIIGLPTRCLGELSRAQLTAILAHELAHHRRKDSVWLGGLSLMAGVFFFQPLLRVALRQLHLAAEIQCDRESVRLTGEPTVLASSLADVAGWLVESQVRHVPLTCAVHPASPLTERIQRLLSEEPEKSVAWWAKLAWCLPGLLTLMVAPGFAQRLPEPEKASRTTEASSWSSISGERQGLQAEWEALKRELEGWQSDASPEALESISDQVTFIERRLRKLDVLLSGIKSGARTDTRTHFHTHSGE